MSRLQTTQGTVRFDWQRQHYPDPTRKVLRACLIGCAVVLIASQWAVTFYGAFL